MEFKFKKILYFGLTTIGLTLPLSLHATDLTITNDTNRDSTSIINHAACSTLLDGGITKAHTVNIVKEKILFTACFLNRNNCQADVYMTDNCTGPKVATVIFDIYSGLKSIQTFDNSYSFSGEGFHFNLAGGPSLTDKA
jgi:hypothetical protein